jgi:2-polyprenyl-6-methoxyphenol hydroxylase-like FAD-dependent oxidoreductase
LKHFSTMLAEKVDEKDEQKTVNEVDDSTGVPLTASERKRRNKALRLAMIKQAKVSARIGATPTAHNVSTIDNLVIGIAGGGIGGFALALALQKKGIRSVVFEKDISIDARHQGYGLTLQQGGRALKALGIIDTLRSESQSSSSHFIFNNQGRVVIWWGAPVSVQQSGASAQEWGAQRNAHISRQALRRVLYDLLDPSFVTICWSSPLIRFDAVAQGIDVTTALGAHHVDCLVGGDGIFSRVRALCNLSNDHLLYLGMFVMLGIFDHSPFPQFGSRIVQMSDGAARIFMMPYDSGRYMWQLSFPMSELQQAISLSKSGGECLLREAIARCASFHEPILQLLSGTDPALVTGYPVYDRDPLPPNFMPDAESRVTLLGDAAHPMTPFKGQGANQAIIDAVNLADQLAALPSRDHLPAALRAFEAEMMERTSSKVLGSREAVRQLHSKEFLDTQFEIQRRGFSPTDVELLARLDLMHQHGAGIADPIILDHFAFGNLATLHSSDTSSCSSTDNGHDRNESDE